VWEQHRASRREIEPTPCPNRRVFSKTSARSTRLLLLFVLVLERVRKVTRGGRWKRYHESGKVYDVGEYRDGEKTGVWKYYDKHGKLIRTKTL